MSQRSIAVAQGNHWQGYRGVIIRDYNGPKEHWALRCPHRHKTTSEARECVTDVWRGRAAADPTWESWGN